MVRAGAGAGFVRPATSYVLHRSDDPQMTPNRQGFRPFRSRQDRLIYGAIPKARLISQPVLRFFHP